MTRRAPRCRQVRLVDLHFSGRISVDEERELREHLGTCGSCRQRYERWLLLSELDRTMPTAARRLGVGLGLVAPRLNVHAVAGWVALGTALGCSVVVYRARHPVVATSVARDANATLPPQGIEFAAYRATGAAKFALLHPNDEVAASQEVGFAYANAGNSKRLMILAVVERTRRAVWYHPRAAATPVDPEAVPIANGDLVHEVPGGTLPPLQDENVRLLAVFTNRDDLRASEVEAAVAAAPPGRIPSLPGCELRAMPLHVHARESARVE